MLSPMWNFITVTKRIMNRRLAAGIWIICLIGLFSVSHLALVRIEKARDFNTQNFQNSTIERLFQRLMISDRSLCSNECAVVNDSNRVLNEETQNAIESNDITEYQEDGNEIVEDSEGKGEVILLPEREEVVHPEQYQKDLAKKLRTWTKEMTETQKAVFQKRISSVKEVCDSMELSGAFAPKMGSVFDNIRWVSKQNFIWCPVFKAGSTNWVKNLLMIAGESKIQAKSLHARVRQLYGPPEDPQVRDKLLQEATKMMIVRHPLERLLSAYRDKMLRVRHAHDPFVRVQQEIMRLYPDPDAPSPPPTPPHTTDDGPKSKKNKKKPPTTHPTFKQYLMKVRDDLRTVWNNGGKTIVNMHWRPFWLTCAPCHIPYDFIGKVETLDLDQEYIIKELGLEDLLYNAHTHSSNFDSYNTTSDAAKDYFRQIPVSLLKDIVELYKPDFTLFDYSPEFYLKLAKPDE